MKKLILNISVIAGSLILVGCGSVGRSDNIAENKPPEILAETTEETTLAETTAVITTDVSTASETETSITEETSATTAITSTTITTTVKTTEKTTAKVTTKTTTKTASNNNSNNSNNSVSTTATATPVTQTQPVTTVSTIPPEIIIENYPTAEVYSEITLGNMISNSNITIENYDTLIDTSYIGDKTADVKFWYNGTEYTKQIKYNVVDITPPVILNNGWSPYVQLYSQFDLSSLIGYADNYDRNPVLTYEGYVDTNYEGTYPITVYVTDSSGNVSSWTMNVYVVSSLPESSPNPTVPFDYYVQKYAGQNVRLGLDISAWQPYIDFPTIKEAGVEFVIMRMGYYYGEIKMDDYYYRNMQEAQANGLDVGVYIYTTATTEDEVREQARWMAETLGYQSIYFPIAFDWEDFDHFQKYGMSIHDLNHLFDVFYDELSKYGYYAMLYSSRNFLYNFWENKNNRTVWLAHFIDETDYTGEYAIWQTTADCIVPGIDRIVDVDIQYMDRPLYK